MRSHPAPPSPVFPARSIARTLNRKPSQRVVATSTFRMSVILPGQVALCAHHHPPTLRFLFDAAPPITPVQARETSRGKVHINHQFRHECRIGWIGKIASNKRHRWPAPRMTRMTQTGSFDRTATTDGACIGNHIVGGDSLFCRCSLASECQRVAVMKVAETGRMTNPRAHNISKAGIYSPHPESVREHQTQEHEPPGHFTAPESAQQPTTQKRNKSCHHQLSG